MTHPTLRIVRLQNAEGLPLPRYETAGSAGLDLRAALHGLDSVVCYGAAIAPGAGDIPRTPVMPGGVVVLPPGARALIPTGLVLAIPDGHEGQIRPRSGLALRTGYGVHPGTVDADYRCPVGVIVYAPPRGMRIRHGDRIAQLIVAPVARVDVAEVESLDATGRVGGFGSTGVR